MMKLRLAVLALIVACALAFVPPMPHKPVRTAKPLFAAEVNVFTQADKCLGGECSVEDVSELLTQLRVQVKALKEQTKALEQLEAELSGKNTGKDVDQVKALITAVLRALDVDPDDNSYPEIIAAAGFSGTPFKGKVAEQFKQWKKA